MQITRNSRDGDRPRRLVHRHRLHRRGRRQPEALARAGGQRPLRARRPRAWHTHPFGQAIQVTEGARLCQRRGGPIEVIHPGDSVYFEPGEDHWHGALTSALADVDRILAVY